MSQPLPPDLDPECVEILKALWGLGIQTTGSCWGHGKQPFQVWMPSADLRERSWAVLSWAVGYGYTDTQPPQPPGEWRIYVYRFDSWYKVPLCLMLEGPARASAGNELAARIREVDKEMK